VLTSSWAVLPFSCPFVATKGASPDNTFRSYLKFDVTDIQAGDRVTVRLNGRLSSAATASARTFLYAVTGAVVSSVSWSVFVGSTLPRPRRCCTQAR
jgi:hypothetical protein